MGRRRVGLVFGVWALLLLVAVFGVVLDFPLVRGSGTIYIRADGSINPPTASIQRDGDLYTFTDNIYDSIVIERSNIIIDGNKYTLQSSGGWGGFHLSGINNVTIKRTNIKGFVAGVYLYAASNNTISGNNITNNGDGIRIMGSSNNTIDGNNIADNYGCGVWLYEIWLQGYSSHNTISGNNITNNENGGISGYKSDYNIILENTITSNPIGVSIGGSYNDVHENNVINNGDGIGIEGSFNTIRGNNIQHSAIGVWLNPFSGSYNTIYGNNITNNGNGIVVDSHMPDNKIYHNNFVNNTYQAEETWAPVNIWDDGYPSGGNYWNDYSGVDLYSGPFQNETGSDGIGDTPYSIYKYSQDRYPLMEPYVLDLIPPTTLDDYDGLWHTRDFTITLIATDDFSGVAETYYKINDGPTKTVSADGQPLITTEGANNTLEYWSVDNVGNEESHHTLTEIKLDKTTPTIGVPSRIPDEDILPEQEVKISVTVTDALSEVKNVTLSYTTNDGNTWTNLPMNYNPSTTLYEATIPPQRAGTWVKYKIVAQDNAGNQATKDGTDPYSTYQVIPEFPTATALPTLIILTILAVALRKKMDARR